MEMNNNNFSLTNREKQLILYLRKVKFGKIEIDIRDGQPQPIVRQVEKKFDISKIEFDKNL